MIAPGDIAPRRDSEHELYVAVLSNALHRATDTGRVITCPFIPGRVPEDLLAMVVAVEQPNGTLLPELVQWLHVAALGAPLGNAGVAALREAASVVTALLLALSPAKIPDIARYHRKMSDVLIRDIPDDVLASLDAIAARLGLSRTEYIRRRLAQDAQTARVTVTAADLRRLRGAVAGLGDPELMRQAWR